MFPNPPYFLILKVAKYGVQHLRVHHYFMIFETQPSAFFIFPTARDDNDIFSTSGCGALFARAPGKCFACASQLSTCHLDGIALISLMQEQGNGSARLRPLGGAGSPLMSSEAQSPEEPERFQHPALPVLPVLAVSCD